MGSLIQRKQALSVAKNSGVDFESIVFDLQKKYYYSEELEIVPFNNVLSEIPLKKVSKDEIMGSIRFFCVNKFVYQEDVKISHKLKSVFSALHSINSSLIYKIVSDGKVCKLYIGVKSSETVNQKAEVLKGALIGNFPGSSFGQGDKVLSNDSVLELNNRIFNKCSEVTSVVGIPSVKNKEEDSFIQGIENLILGMDGKEFTAIFIADPIQGSMVDANLDAYEKIYSVLSSQKEFVVTEGENFTQSSSSSFTSGSSSSEAKTNSESEGTSSSTTVNSSPWIGRKLVNGLFGAGSKTGDNVASGLENFVQNVAFSASFGVSGLLGAKDIVKDAVTGSDDFSKRKFASIDLKTKGEGNKTSGSTTTYTNSTSSTNSSNESTTDGKSTSQGTNSSRQKTFTDKKVSNFLDRLDKQVGRLEQGKGVGFWNVGAFFLSNTAQNSVIAANIYNGVIKGEESNFEASVVKTFNVLQKQERDKVIDYLKRYEIPRIVDYGFLGQAVTTDELTVQINLPHKSIKGLDVFEITPFGSNPDTNVDKGIKIGKLYNYNKVFENDIVLDYNKFTSHIFVTGSTGSGKSNVTYNLLDKLLAKNIKFMVIEPVKGEYKDEFGNRKGINVYGTKLDESELLRVNPFEFPKEIHVYEHIDRFIEILNACWPMEAAMPNILKEAVEDAYVSLGWFLDESKFFGEEVIYPTFNELLVSLERVISQSDFSAEVKSNYQGALVSRVKSMTNGLNKLIFSRDSISDKDLFDENVIVDLSRVASSESKALFMGILLMKLNEYRISTKQGNNSDLKHITVLEEAHNLLKRTSSEASGNSANLVGKSVEMIANSIAEMRTYGQGFVIADQAPGLLDMSVIRNTNTKICLRLPDFEDRKLVGTAMNLNEEQIRELANLETGVAAIYQNNWQEAIQCKFDKFTSKHSKFIYKDNSKQKGIAKVLELMSSYEKNKSLSLSEEAFVLEQIGYDFIVKHPLIASQNVSKSQRNLNLRKLLAFSTELDVHKVVPIHNYVKDYLDLRGVAIK